MKKNLSLIIGAAACSLFTLVNSGLAQGTAFTYQGRLQSGTNFATGSFDMSFSLFAVSSGGVAIAGPVTNTAVSVTNGLFTTIVNFGNAFTGASNWLQIAVSTNAANAFIFLGPRQQLTPTPYAVFAESANAGSLVGTGYFSGNVGIGVTNPADALDITAGGVIGNNTTIVSQHDPSNRGTKISFGYRDPATAEFNGMSAVVNPGSLCGNSGDLLFYTWACNFSTSREVMRINGAGNVGVGTTNPLARLDVNGSIGIESTTNVLELGIGVAGKESNAGKIGYEKFTADSLDIVGAGTNSASRKIKFWAEAGANFNGPATFNSNVGIGTTTPQLPLDVNSFNYAVPAAQFGVANCGGDCGQTNWQEAIRLWNQNGNGQVGLSFLVGAGSFNSNAVPGVWIGTAYRASANDNDFQIATRTNANGTNLINRFYINGTSGNVGIGTTAPSTALQVNGTVTATSFSGSFAGNGSSLTNVAHLNGGNNFTGQQTVTNPAGTFGFVHSDGIREVGTYCDANGGWFGTISDHPLLFYVNNGFASMAIATNGNAGIGTVTPANKLDVQGSGDFTGNLGIGITTPATTLQVVGNVGIGSTVNTSSELSIAQTGGQTQLELLKPGSNLGYQFATDSGGLDICEHNIACGRFYIQNGTGNVGIGTTTPAGHLSVATAQGTVNIMDGQFTPELIMTGGGADGTLRLRSRLEVWPKTNLTAAGYLDVRNTNGNATITLDGTNGNITCVAINITSDRNAKENFSPINARAVLDKVASLPISEWQYKQQADTRHIGPMAQDFSSAFALGSDDKHISVVDEGGVALAAIQGLNQKLEETRAENAELKQTVSDLKVLVGQLQQHLAKSRSE